MDIYEFLSVLADILQNRFIQVLATLIVASSLQLISHATISKLVKRAVRSHKYHTKSDEKKREQTLVNVFRTAAAVSIWLLALVIILWQLRINIAALLTGAGLIGVIVGFGAQNAIKDFLAGIFIIAENQYRVGDIITLRVGGQEISGIVEEITIRITRLRDLDGNLHIVQNGAPEAITNRSFGFANVNIDISVAYDSDVDHVERVINQVGKSMASDQEWSECVIEPIVFLRVDGFEDSAVRIKALGKVLPSKQWDVAGEFRRRLKKAFEKEKITIPFPQVVIHEKNN